MVSHIITRALAEGRTNLTEIESKDVLEEADISVVETKMATSTEDAVSLANDMGYPVVMKISSIDILHKSDAKGVRTGIENADSVSETFHDIMRAAREYDPGARIEGVTVQQQVPRGVEIIIGGTVDPIFEEVVMFGLGGVWIELMKDVSFRLAPTTKEEAMNMIREIKGYPLLRDFRGRAGVDMNAIAESIVKVSHIMRENPIAELDINPLFARTSGVICVDARIVMKKEDGADAARMKEENV